VINLKFKFKYQDTFLCWHLQIKILYTKLNHIIFQGQSDVKGQYLCANIYEEEEEEYSDKTNYFGVLGGKLYFDFFGNGFKLLIYSLVFII